MAELTPEHYLCYFASMRGEDSGCPKVVLSGDMLGSWKVEIHNPKALAARVDTRLFAAFLKCQIAIDRILTLEQCIVLNQSLPAGTPARERNLTTLATLLAGVAHELTQALQEICNARIDKHIPKSENWKQLNELRRSLKKDRSLALIRNNLSAHLGGIEAIESGLIAKLESDAPLLFVVGHGSQKHDNRAVLAHDALLHGLGIEASEFERAISLSFKTHVTIPNLLLHVLIEFLNATGVEVVNMLEDPVTE